MLGTEVFEILTVSKKTIGIGEKYLKNQALEDFKKAIEG
jgi:hypothetical protein